MWPISEVDGVAVLEGQGHVGGSQGQEHHLRNVDPPGKWKDKFSRFHILTKSKIVERFCVTKMCRILTFLSNVVFYDQLAF